MKATFIGIKNSETLSKEDVLNNECIYMFIVGNEIKEFKISGNDTNYSIRNRLMKDYEYDIEVSDDKITSVNISDKDDINGIVTGYTPGKRTLKNFLETSLAPLGKTLYVYGGGWNFQDEGSSYMATTIGVSPTWERFYQKTDENYSYKDDTYPINGWNEYYYAGLDCSGYVGWTLYNTMNTDSEKSEGYVGPSTKLAKKLSESYEYGTWTHPTTKDYTEISKQLHPGDIISITGHIYIVLGRCSDGSIVIIHSTVSDSVTNVKGGGVQISAISPKGDNDTECEAYALAKYYMENYFSNWSQKYPPVVKPVSTYFDFPANRETTGIFSWYIGSEGLDDPENIKNMNAEQVLQTIFEAKEKTNIRVR